MQKKSKIPVVCGILCVSLVGGFAYYVKNPDILLNINKNNEGTYQEYKATDEDMDFVNKYTNTTESDKYDKFGRPYLEEGQNYTFSNNGLGAPNEVPRSGKASVLNPNTGEKWLLSRDGEWHIGTAKERQALDDKIARGEISASGVTAENGRKLTDEEISNWTKNATVNIGSMK